MFLSSILHLSKASLIFSILLFLCAYSKLYKSSHDTFNCSNLFHLTLHESFLLLEGDGFVLDCNVCSKCYTNHEMCDPGGIKIGLSVHGDKTSGDQNPVTRAASLNTSLYSTTLEHIRLRLRKRIWRNLSLVSNELPLLYEGAYMVTKITSEADLITQSSSKLYFTVTKSDQTTTVIRRSTENIYVDKDVFRVRRAKPDHTGIYRCIFEGQIIRVWSVTVLRPGEEPFRNIFLPMKIATNQSELVSGNNIQSADYMRPIPTQYLVNNNLKLFTYWYSWSDCVPCTPKDPSPFTQKVPKGGMQIRIGICHATPIDRFYLIKPNALAAEAGEAFKLFSEPGLPCRSHLIKNSIWKYGPKEIHLRPSELVIRPCVLECSSFGDVTSSSRSSFNKLSRFPKRISIQVNEGKPLIITCPVRGSIVKPITWFYAPENFDNLMKLIKTAYNQSIIYHYKTPLRYLMTKLKQVNFTTLTIETRGRYRIDSAYNILIAETISLKKTQHTELYNLICVHGDAYSIPNSTDNYPEWSGIIHIDVLPQSYLARILSKLTPVIQIIMPFILALGIFFIVILTLYTERQPKMHRAAKGIIVK
ncbi:Ig-like V-type domain-containing protein [Schistosoma japonicum]|nr:Ig-like V-type domain-containing protein [Schistosoma japonicum]